LYEPAHLSLAAASRRWALKQRRLSPVPDQTHSAKETPMTDPNLPTRPPMPRLAPYHPAASNAPQSTDAPGQAPQTPRTPPSADPWTPPSGASIPMVPRQAASKPPPSLNQPTPSRKGGAPAPQPAPGPRPVPFKPAK